MLQYRLVPVTAYQQNCSIIWCDSTFDAAIIDPGGDVDQLKEEMASLSDELGVKVTKILLTHGHMDHVGGTAALKAQLQLPVIGPHQDDNFWIDALDMQAQMMNFTPVEGFQPDRWLEHQDRVEVGELSLQVLHCPGHTPGHVVFYQAESKLAFVGDVLFSGSIGRTDFPRGDHQQLLDSIKTRLLPLGDDITFIPGHGPLSTFGQERQTNPYVADHRFG